MRLLVFDRKTRAILLDVPNVVSYDEDSITQEDGILRGFDPEVGFAESPETLDTDLRALAAAESAAAKRLRYIEQAAVAYPSLTSGEKGACSTFSNALLNTDPESEALPNVPPSLVTAWGKLGLPV